MEFFFMTMKFVTMILIGVTAGLCSGFFGIGGGVIIVPALIFIAGMSQWSANGTSLVALLLPVGLLGVYEYYRAQKITGEHIKLGLLIALGIFVGTALGSKIAVGLSERTLRMTFGVFLVGIAVKLWFF